MSTQKQVLETVLAELQHIKTHMPNGEMQAIQEMIEEIKDDLTDLKIRMLDPDEGVIVKTNQNTWFRREFENEIKSIPELVKFKNTVNKALWVIFTALTAVIIQVVLLHQA